MDEKKRMASKPFHFEEHDQGYQKLLKALQALAAKSSNKYRLTRRFVNNRPQLPAVSKAVPMVIPGAGNVLVPCK